MDRSCDELAPRRAARHWPKGYRAGPTGIGWAHGAAAQARPALPVDARGGRRARRRRRRDGRGAARDARRPRRELPDRGLQRPVAEPPRPHGRERRRPGRAARRPPRMCRSTARPTGPRSRAQRSVVLREGEDTRVIAPVTSRGEAVGVLELILPFEPAPATLEDLELAAHQLAYMVIANRRYTDLFEWGQRTVPLSLAAEIQRRLLPATYTCEADQFTLAGWLEPAGRGGRRHVRLLARPQHAAHVDDRRDGPLRPRRAAGDARRRRAAEHPQALRHADRPGAVRARGALRVRHRRRLRHRPARPRRPRRPDGERRQRRAPAAVPPARRPGGGDRAHRAAAVRRRPRTRAGPPRRSRSRRATACCS